MNMRSHLSLLAALVVALLGLAGPIATRGAEQPYSVLVNKTNGNLLTPTNWFSLLATNPAFATNVQAAASNSVHAATNALWGAVLTASNATHLTASNSAYVAATNFSLATTSGVWSAVLTASNATHLAASNSAYGASTNFTLAATNAAWSVHLMVSNATYWAVSNATYAAAVANTLSATQTLATALVPPSYLAPQILQPKAQYDALAYGRQVAAAGGPNLATNGEAHRIAAALNIIYTYVGETSLVDAAWWKGGQTVTTGTNVPTMRGRFGQASQISYAQSGLYQNGTNSVLNFTTFPDLRTNTICIRMATDTNVPSSSYACAYCLVNTNAYTSGMSSSLIWNSALYYLHTYAGGLDIGEAIFERDQNPTYTEGYSDGLPRGQLAPRNVIVTCDGVTNALTWVDGLLGQHDTNVALAVPNTVSRLAIGMRADGVATYSNPNRGYVSQLLVFNRVLTSNEVVWVDKAMALAAGEIPFVCQGDSITEFSQTTGWQGIEWPQQMWWQLGALTNRLVIHNHSYSGRTAFTLSNEMPSIIWHRQASLQSPNGFYALNAGINDIIGGNYATNIFRCLSNMWFYARTNGYTVLAGTLTSWSTTNANYTGGRETERQALNALIMDATNNPVRPFHYLMPFHLVLTNGDTQTYDGLHPTPATKTQMGQLVGTNIAFWFGL